MTPDEDMTSALRSGIAGARLAIAGAISTSINLGWVMSACLIASLKKRLPGSPAT
ncbi:MAG TPA: hypothetical protein VK569_02320 [Bacteroidota bacterium]|nr:hypothetical protein [Bacteroidota bacterium]